MLTEPNDYQQSREHCQHCGSNLYELPWDERKRINACLNVFCPRYRNPAGVVPVKEKMVVIPGEGEEPSSDSLVFNLRVLRKIGG